MLRSVFTKPSGLLGLCLFISDNFRSTIYLDYWTILTCCIGGHHSSLLYVGAIWLARLGVAFELGADDLYCNDVCRHAVSFLLVALSQLSKLLLLDFLFSAVDLAFSLIIRDFHILQTFSHYSVEFSGISYCWGLFNFNGTRFLL